MKLIFFIYNILLKIKRTKPRYKAVQQIKTYNYKIQTTLKGGEQQTSSIFLNQSNKDLRKQSFKWSKDISAPLIKQTNGTKTVKQHILQQKTTFLLKDLNTYESWAVSCDRKQKIKYIQTNTEKNPKWQIILNIVQTKGKLK